MGVNHVPVAKQTAKNGRTVMASFHEYKRTIKIPAGEIARHPVHQRPSPIKAFERRLGEFDIHKCVDLIHVVKNDGDGPKWLAVDGATRVEACKKSKKFGPSTQLECRVYGNGVPPSGTELDELFLILNSDKVKTHERTTFERSVGAERESAVFAKSLIDKLGPKFDGHIGLWSAVRKFGKGPAEKAVDFAVSTWGTSQHMPSIIIKVLAEIFASKEDTARLFKRKSAIRKQSPENWRLRAQTKMYQQVGRRDTISTYMVRVLLGEPSWTKSKQGKAQK